MSFVARRLKTLSLNYVNKCMSSSDASAKMSAFDLIATKTNTLNLHAFVQRKHKDVIFMASNGLTNNVMNALLHMTRQDVTFMASNTSK